MASAEALKTTGEGPTVGFFVTCLVDAIRPNIGVASVKLLEAAGCTVEIPRAQTCCGQPAFNSGVDDAAAAIAKQVIRAFEPYDYVVLPSGSCGGMIKDHFPELFADDAAWRERAEKLSAKTHEILSFLTDIRGWRPEGVRFDATVTYHDSCAGLRELGIYEQPRALMGAVDGLSLTPLENSDVCCGFGGTFCVKYPEISTAIAEDKTRSVKNTGAEVLLGGDLGCLMNMAGKLSREGSDVRVFHLIEVLAGLTDVPAICEPSKG